VKNCGYYMIATMDGDQPRVRPFGTMHIFEDKLYFQAAHSKRIARQLALNGKVELCAMHPEGHAWIRVSGTVIEDERIEAKRSMLDDYSDMRSIYDEHDDQVAVYCFLSGVAYITTHDGEREIRF